MNIHVDTLEYAHMLEESGMARAQAEAVAKLQARAVKDLIDHELVTQDHLKAGLDSLETRLRDEIRGESAKLREEIRGESAKLREESRDENAKLRGESRDENAKLRGEIQSFSVDLHDEIRAESAKLRDEIRNEATDSRRQMDALMIQIRAIQFGGAIAAFAVSAVVLMSRLIR